MNSFRVFVPGVPVAWPRAEPRVVYMGGVARAIVYVGVKTPVRRWQHDIRAAVQTVYTGPLMLGAIGLTAEFICPRAKKYIFARKPMPRRLMTDVPDTSNYIKAVEDALVIDRKKPGRFAVMRDDRQVCHVAATKWYARMQTPDAGEPAGLYLAVTELNPEPLEFPEPEMIHVEEEDGESEPEADRTPGREL